MRANLSHLWILSRPRLLPFVLWLPLIGYGWAHWDRALRIQAPGAILLVLIAWGLLHAATLWLNAALDRDEGEVLYGESAPVPDGIERVAMFTLLLALLLALPTGPVAFGSLAICAALAVLYSHPRTVWKGHSQLGPLTNLLGYGLLSPLAGWSVVGVSPNPRTMVMWSCGALGVFGCYFAAQAFQQEEDAARGYRTLVVTHGPRGALNAGRICIGGALIGVCLLALLGWLPRPCLIAAPLGLWVDHWLATWAQLPGGGSEAWARGLASRLLFTGVAMLLLASGEYVRSSLAGEPVAGLGTAAGHPSDRPLLSPAAMRSWEAAQGTTMIPGAARTAHSR